MVAKSRRKLAAGTGKRRALRDILAERQNWRCCHCGVRMIGTNNEPNAPTFEHVIPLANGGRDEECNVVVACYECNSTRGIRRVVHGIERRRLLDQFQTELLPPFATLADVWPEHSSIVMD